MIRCSKRSTSSDFFRARLSSISPNDITIISCAYRRSQTPIRIAQSNIECQKQKRRPKIPDAALQIPILDLLEREINPRANHAKIIGRSVHKVPAEIADPADVRSHANFHATAYLADCPRLGTSLFRANDSVVHDNVRAFASTKDSAASTKNVGREAWYRESGSAMSMCPTQNQLHGFHVQYGRRRCHY